MLRRLSLVFALLTAVALADPVTEMAAFASLKNVDLAKLGGGPEKVAKAIEKAIGARRPRARYPVTASARLILMQRRLLPDRAWDAFMRTQFPVPRNS